MVICIHTIEIHKKKEKKNKKEKAIVMGRWSKELENRSISPTFQASSWILNFRLIEIRKVPKIAEVTFTFVFRDMMTQFETRVTYQLFFDLPAKFYHSDDKNNK